jgi:hypothetical protein
VATDIKLDEQLVIVEALGLKVTGADIQIDSAERRGNAGGTARRALVHGPGDALVLNWAQDYTGGVYLNGLVRALNDVTVPVMVWPTQIRRADGGIEPLGVTPTQIETVAVGAELTRLRGEMALLREHVEVLRMHASIRADASHHTQEGWFWCWRCAGLVYGTNVTRSVCPAVGGGPHDVSQSSQYVLFPHKSRYAGQGGWGWCNKCQGLCYGTAVLTGYCPAGSAHDRTDSPNYWLWGDFNPQGSFAAKDFPAQDNWRYCLRCNGMLHSGGGVCPAPGGGAHNTSTSGNYFLQTK